jgi:uncharacterized OB-fold protein
VSDHKAELDRIDAIREERFGGPHKVEEYEVHERTKEQVLSRLKCSECGETVRTKWRYCPMCGERFREVE